MAASTPYKVILLGDYGVGKTSIVEQVQREMQASVTDIKHAELTLSVSQDGNPHAHKVEQLEFTLFTLQGGKSHSLKIRLFDTAGAERYNRSAVTSNYFRNADAALLVYSVSDSNTFENLSEWIELAKRYVDHHKSERFVWCFVGNKSDEERAVQTQRVEYSCQQLNTRLNFTTCARTGEGVMDAIKATVATAHARWTGSGTGVSTPPIAICSTTTQPPPSTMTLTNRCSCNNK